MLKKYSGESFDDLIKEGKWLVDFSATWCGPCRMIEPILESLSSKHNILTIDVDNYKELAIRFGIMSIPALLVFDNGEKKKETIGYHTEEELEELLK